MYIYIYIYIYILHGWGGGASERHRGLPQDQCVVDSNASKPYTLNCPLNTSFFSLTHVECVGLRGIGTHVEWGRGSQRAKMPV